ncbi:ER protein Pkr1-domain-containing protein [Lenzites betulinus]|nr:ER protein Pkr1-domain-containing protein [Lenzites betulinus]
MDQDDHSKDTLASAPALNDGAQDGFFDNILTPGSSLNPTFLLIVDSALGLLLLVLFGLLVLTRGNIHLLFLMVIECCLWASVKWFVHELRQTQESERNTGTTDAGAQGENKASKPKSE